MLPKLKTDIALLILRLSGLYLAFGHGLGKLSSLMAGQTGFIEGVARLGFPLPTLFAWAAGLAEFVGGILIVLGLFTRISATFAGITVAVAGFLRHHALDHLFIWLGLASFPEDTVSSWGNPEKALVYSLCLAAMAILGPGKISLDHVIRKRRRQANAAD